MVVEKLLAASQQEGVLEWCGEEWGSHGTQLLWTGVRRTGSPKKKKSVPCQKPVLPSTDISGTDRMKYNTHSIIRIVRMCVYSENNRRNYK